MYMRKFPNIVIALILIALLSAIFIFAYHRTVYAPIHPLTTSPIPTVTKSFQVKHIFIIMMENKEKDSVIGNKDAPYINMLAKKFSSASNYYGVTHPSLPNYIALTSGGTQGITTDCTNCFIATSNIADTLEASGYTWKAYMEDLPSPCFVGNSGKYAQKHDPFIYFDDIRENILRCQNHVVPISSLYTDIATSSVPSFSFISPNLCNDMHDCSVSTGDTWLATIVPKLMSVDSFSDGIIVITWDEGDSLSIKEGGNIPMLIISSVAKRDYVSSIEEDHYSLLRTIEDIWHLPLLGSSRDASPMTEYFSIPL